MKFSKKHYESLKLCVKNTLQKWNTTISDVKSLHYHSKPEICFLWDLFWASKWSSICLSEYLEGDYKDDHITTAMRAIVKELS